MKNFASRTKKKLVIREIDPNTDLLKIFHYSRTYSKSFFLDSAIKNEKTGRYSFIGYDPFLTVMSKGNNILMQSRHSITKKVGNPFDELRTLLSNLHIDNNDEPIPFTCGAVGYFAYDLCHFIEKLPNTTIDDIEFPEMCFSFYDTIIGFDHLENKCYLATVDFSSYSNKSTEKRIDQVLRMVRNRLSIPYEEEPRFSGNKIKRKIISNFSKENYLQAIECAKQYIYAGDIYQVNLSQRFQTQIEMSPYVIYKRLRKINPAPFSCYLRFDNKYVISSSPERFLSLRNTLDNTGKHNETIVRNVQTRPIKVPGPEVTIET